MRCILSTYHRAVSSAESGLTAAWVHSTGCQHAATQHQYQHSQATAELQQQLWQLQSRQAVEYSTGLPPLCPPSTTQLLAQLATLQEQYDQNQVRISVTNVPTALLVMACCTASRQAQLAA